MGRPPSYTDEMDEVILSHRKVEDVLRIFRERGWGERSEGAIAQRRHYLKRQGFATDFSAETLAERYTRLLTRQRTLERDLALAKEQVEDLERMLANIRAQVAEVLAEMSEEAAAQDEAT